MKELSIFNSITLLRGADPDAIMDLEAGFRKRDGWPANYVKKEYRDLYNASRHLAPLVSYSRDDRYLFCRGADGSSSIYASNIDGSAAGLVGSSCAKLGSDGFYAFWQNRELARNYDAHAIEKDPRIYFNLDLRLVSQNNRERTISCIIRGNGDIYTSNWGELFPFENPNDYSHLNDGVWPEMHILEGFCGLFGWPPPTSPDYPKFITSCILYEFPPSPDHPACTVNKELQDLALHWPWETPRKRFGLF